MSEDRLPLTAAHLSGPSRAPVLVLGNSLGTSVAVWDRQVPQLQRSFRLLRFELPGHGGSAAPPGEYTIAGLGARVLALLDSLGVDRVGYCGTSLGGMIGMWLAAHAPQRIAALGLVCTSAYLPPAADWLARADQVRAAGMASVCGPVISRWFTPEYAAAAPAVVDGFRAEFERTDPGGYAGCCAAIACMDQRPALPAIAAPTLVLAGADDPATPLAARRGHCGRHSRRAPGGHFPGGTPGGCVGARAGHLGARGAPACCAGA